MNSATLINLKKKYWQYREWIALFSDYTNFKQLLNPKEIPFIIINFNQLFYLEKLVNFAINRGFKKIIIIDNVSTYPPLLDYYREIEGKVILEKMDKNYGHMVFFNTSRLYDKYGKNFFILTDADIEPNAELPKNFLRKMFWLLLNHIAKVLKVGFALKIDDIPDSFPAKEKVIKWESKFWQKEIAKNIYESHIDTTFALYKPDPKKFLNPESNFYLALRIGGKYTAKHGGWYIDNNNLTAEQKFYSENANASSSWLADNAGNIKGDYKNLYR